MPNLCCKMLKEVHGWDTLLEVGNFAIIGHMNNVALIWCYGDEIHHYSLLCYNDHEYVGEDGKWYSGSGYEIHVPLKLLSIYRLIR